MGLPSSGNRRLDQKALFQQISTSPLLLSISSRCYLALLLCTHHICLSPGPSSKDKIGFVGVWKRFQMQSLDWDVFLNIKRQWEVVQGSQKVLTGWTATTHLAYLTCFTKANWQGYVELHPSGLSAMISNSRPMNSRLYVGSSLSVLVLAV